MEQKLREDSLSQSPEISKDKKYGPNKVSEGERLTARKHKP
jgi:hypothetical protein